MTASGPGEEAPRPTADQQTAAVLAAAVAEIGGHERAGQLQLAAAVGDAFDTGVHLLAQAGTGTGKSLGYLAPTLVRLARGDLDRVVVTTATLALQSQLASKDIPSALDAVESVTGRRPSHAILKGRTNYACLLKVRDGADDQAALIPASELVASLQEAPRAAPESALGAEVLALREWAEE
jgi:ATP-dependent DNA helicase DinG